MTTTLNSVHTWRTAIRTITLFAVLMLVAWVAVPGSLVDASAHDRMDEVCPWDPPAPATHDVRVPVADVSPPSSIEMLAAQR